jgi:hypothetical protein
MFKKIFLTSFKICLFPHIVLCDLLEEYSARKNEKLYEDKEGLIKKAYIIQEGKLKLLDYINGRI